MNLVHLPTAITYSGKECFWGGKTDMLTEAPAIGQNVYE